MGVNQQFYSVFSKYLDNVDEEKEQQLVRCIFHDDTHPSLSINLNEGLFYCHACKVGGNIDKFLQLVGDKPPSLEEYVDKFHNELLLNTKLFNFLLKTRLISEEVIRKRKIGYDTISQRYVIPVYDLDNNLVGLRKYKPYAVTGKIMQIGDSFVVYPADLLHANPLVFCEGEIDALTLISNGIDAVTLLPPSNVNAVTEIAEFLNDKFVIVIYDTDETGKELANKLHSQIRMYTKKVKVINLGYYKDIGHFIQERSITELKELIYKEDFIVEETEEILPYMSVSNIIDVKHLRKRFNVDFHVVGKSLSPFVIPFEYQVICPASLPFCDKCALKSFGGTYEGEMKMRDLPEYVTLNDSKYRSVFSRKHGIPSKCNHYVIQSLSDKFVYELKVSNRLDEKMPFENVSFLDVMCVADNDIAEPNRSYTSVMFTTKSNAGKLVGVATNVEPIQYVMKHELLPSMLQFRDDGDVFEKYLDIVRDLKHILKVNERDQLIMALDLVFHSALYIRFNGKSYKGYLDVLVIGDTGTGKTTAAKGLMDFYKLGDLVDGASVSVAGLIGGVVKTETGIFVSWGIMPLNDTRLICIDEADELSSDVIEKLSYIRSMGVAEVSKVVKNKVNARVRLIMITNPINGLVLKDVAYPIVAIKDFAKHQQDVRRFDYCVTVRGDVSTIKVDETVPTYDVDSYTNLVRFAWSLNENEIIYTFTLDELLDFSTQIASDYESDIPLVEKNAFYEKVLRIATAAAIRTFNYDEQMNKVVVERKHLDFVRRFIDYIYKDENNGYYEYCKKYKEDSYMFDMNDVLGAMSLISDVNFFLSRIQLYSTFNKSDIEDLANVDKDDATKIVSILMRNNCIKRLGNGYYIKTKTFHDRMKEVLDEVNKRRR